MQSLPSERKHHRDGLGIALLLLIAGSWVGIFALTLSVESGWLKFLCCSLLGFNTGVLFIFGHDLCHDAYTSSARFNRIVGQIAFLPALTPPTSWDWGHNRMHHSWTNLAGKDDGYPPPSLEQWRAMSGPRRFWHRVYHTLPGLWLYYLIDVWVRHIIFLDRNERAQLRSVTAYVFDLAVLALFVAAQVAAVMHWGSWRNEAPGWQAMDVFLCIAWPFFLWNWIMTFVTIQHHSHPRARWFDNEAEWSYFQSQVASTVHMKFPLIIELAFGNIFEHTAHHADKRIPLYNLRASQRALEHRYPQNVIIQRASLKHLRDTLKRCRLYDYRAGRWMDYEGRYTS